LKWDEELAVRALEAAVAGGAAAVDRLRGEALVAMRALDLEALFLCDPTHRRWRTRRTSSSRIGTVRRGS
jgi:hypothetical protein